LILNVVVGALVASHESDQVKVPPNHAMVGARRVKVEVQNQWMH